MNKMTNQIMDMSRAARRLPQGSREQGELVKKLYASLTPGFSARIVQDNSPSRVRGAVRGHARRGLTAADARGILNRIERRRTLDRLKTHTQPRAVTLARAKRALANMEANNKKRGIANVQVFLPVDDRLRW